MADGVGAGGGGGGGGGGFLQLIIIFYKRNKPKEFTWLIMHVQRACLNES